MPKHNKTQEHFNACRAHIVPSDKREDTFEIKIKLFSHLPSKKQLFIYTLFFCGAVTGDLCVRESRHKTVHTKSVNQTSLRASFICT